MKVGDGTLKRLTRNAHESLHIHRSAVRMAGDIKQDFVMAAPQALRGKQLICLLNDPSKRFMKCNDERIHIHQGHRLQIR